ncbi:hypothetical protein GDO81_009299 [Engystomops pustulosus]|uniref:Uncharacterized protein n=1 Tax=Engystomops pustulosus TaxID=76066 RepID=A0AAV7BQT3_ENGPU|nr:hypothetical protein GDO81_009299 [Engystomops pustulosus]
MYSYPVFPEEIIKEQHMVVRNYSPSLLFYRDFGVSLNCVPVYTGEVKVITLVYGGTEEHWTICITLWECLILNCKIFTVADVGRYFPVLLLLYLSMAEL